MIRCEELIEKVSSYRDGFDGSIIRKAYVYSAKVHTDQHRLSGEPYLSHPLEVAAILADLKMDERSIAAGILHDTVENTETTVEELRELFGEEISLLVDGVTKISRIEFTSTEEQRSENFRKMIIAMAKDIRVILIKLADRLHNMNTLQYLPKEKQELIAKETAEIYAPLAHRLGIGWIRWQLEDESLKYLHPDIYRDLAQKVAKKRDERMKYTEEVGGILYKALSSAGLKVQVVGRPKHFNGIYGKMIKRNIGFDEVYDLQAFRVITQSINDCYVALGIIHSEWTPVPGRLKDYIAMPKTNMYQSLHTTVIGPKGQRIEIQLRTERMHEIAERGIAAHWVYKTEDKEEVDHIQSEKFNWLRELLDWQKDLKDPKEFMESVRIDLFLSEVYVFTPKGEVRNFPKGATPVDFAYNIHTDIGHRCVGAKISGKIVPLNTKLKSGDTVEILTSPNKKPSKDWLKFVVTPSARTKIKHFLREEDAKKSLNLGKVLVEKELRKHKISLSKVVGTDEFQQICERLGHQKPEQVFVAVGYGKLSASQIARKLFPKESSEGQIAKKLQPLRDKISRVMRRDDTGIKVKDIDNVLIRFAKCCNPVHGDKIRGFITRGRGITIHSQECTLMEKTEIEPERRIDVDWDISQETTRPVKVSVLSEDKKGLLTKITSIISTNNINIISANINVSRDNRGVMNFILEIKDLKQLNKTLRHIAGLRGVLKVDRV